MSKILSSYSFLPWLRLGIANQVQAADNDSSVKLRAPIQLQLQLKADGADAGAPLSKQIGLYGPADIVGIDKRAIIKTEPLESISNFEPNYLAAIDFYEEDLPWRYTPAKPSNDRLRPWITLVVLRDDEFKFGRGLSDRPSPFIEMVTAAADIFPPAEQLWAWAHVHVNDDLIVNDFNDSTVERVISDPTSAITSAFETLVKKNPDRAYSRILCPRQLQENSSYHAFLLPTFESGRLAGLGLDVETIFANETALHATFSAWTDYAAKEEPMNFPYYYHWSFKTGPAGDFEYLVRLLEPKPVDNRVGRRDMDVTQPGSNIDGIGDNPENGTEVNRLNGILRLGGALRIPVAAMSPADREEYKHYDNWAKTPYPREFQKQLAAFINLADDYAKKTPGEAHQNPNLPDKITTDSESQNDPDPLITAPLYGRWHALTNRLLDSSDSIPDNNWIHELNLDPRFRVPAGFGTNVVQDKQEQYMEAAWEQVGKVLEANRQIKFGQLATWVSKRWYKKNVESLEKINTGAFLNLTQPVQTRVLSRGLSIEGKEELLTVHHLVKESVVPAVAFSPNIKQLTRPRGPLVKKLRFKEKNIEPATLADRINKGEVLPAPPKKIPEGLPTIGSVSDEIKPSGSPGIMERWIEKQKWLKFIIPLVSLLIILLFVIFSRSGLLEASPLLKSIMGVALLIALILLALYLSMVNRKKEIEDAHNLSEEGQTAEAVDDFPIYSDFKLVPVGEEPNFTRGSSDSTEGRNFKRALKDAGEVLQAHRAGSVEPIRPRLNLSTIAASTLETIHPVRAIPGYILNNRIYIPGRIQAERLTEIFREAMVYPEIDTPMYKPLIDISSDLFLPNINLIAQNSISLLETNQRFIEAYMVGLNHEFARELLWREYPTDQRGSYFRQFWDAGDYMFPQTELKTMVNQVKADLGASATAEEIERKLQETIKEKLRDIPKLHRWSKYSKLGDHDHRESPGENEEEVVLVIRGELLKKYPNAVIYAHRAKWKPKSEADPTPDRKQERELVPIPSNSEDNPPLDTIKTPLYEAKVSPDIYFFGFNLNVTEVQGVMDGEPNDLEDRAGWFFVIKERPGEPRFGLDIGTTEMGEIEVWNDMSWGNATPAVDANAPDLRKNLQITSATTTIRIEDNALEEDDDEKLVQRAEDVQFDWHKNMNSAELAYMLFQSPAMVAIHGAEMLPKNK